MMSRAKARIERRTASLAMPGAWNVSTRWVKPLVAVGGQHLGHGLRRTDRKRRAAVANAGHVAEFPDRWQLLERARPNAAGLGVDAHTVEIQHLVQPGLAFVPCLVARLGDMQA